MKIGRQERKIHTFCPAGEECRWITHWCLSHILFHRKEGRSVKETSLSVGQKDLWNEYLFVQGYPRRQTHIHWGFERRERERDSCPWKSRDSRRNRDIISSDSQSNPVFMIAHLLLPSCSSFSYSVSGDANLFDKTRKCCWRCYVDLRSWRQLQVSLSLCIQLFLLFLSSLDSFFRVKELLNQHKTVARLLYFFLVSFKTTDETGMSDDQKILPTSFYFFFSHRIAHHLSTKESKVDLFLVVCLCINGPSPLFLPVSLMFDASTCHLKSNSWERRRQRNL